MPASVRPSPSRSTRQGPAPTLILLVRHGATPTTGKILPGRAGGLHLAEKGRVQADVVAARIAAMEKPPTAVYASPLERTRETAAPIASALGLRVRTARGLIEADVGDWTEKSLARLYKTKEWPTVQRWPSGFRFPGGESFTEMSARSKAVVAAAAGVPLDLMQRLVISPCSVSALLFTVGGPAILCVNSTGSLGELVLS